MAIQTNQSKVEESNSKLTSIAICLKVEDSTSLLKRLKIMSLYLQGDFKALHNYNRHLRPREIMVTRQFINLLLLFSLEFGVMWCGQLN